MTEQFTWPNGKKCCVCLTFDLDAEWVFMGNYPETAQMPRKLSLGKYVWDAGVIPRILDLLDKHRVKSTFFIVGMNAVNHPDVIKTIVDRGHEAACHGWQHENINECSKEEEKARLLKTADAIENATGVRPVGNRTAGVELSPNTLDLLWENGFLFDSSLRNSDLPYILERSDGDAGKGLVMVPSYYDMDDFHLFADYPGTKYHGRMLSPETGYEMWTQAFDGYYKYGLCYTTMFHPQIIGKPGLMMLLDRLLNYIRKFPDVWFATAGEIARHCIETRNG
jgi:peptidoglycan-N-acetylglucosamine deacetylase